MRSIRFFLLLLLFGVSQTIWAQANCYETTRMRGVDLYNHGDYQAAAKNFEAAKFCPDLPANNDIDSWLDKCVVNVRLSSKRLEFEAAYCDEQVVEVTTKAKTFKVGAVPSWCTITQQGKMIHVNCADNTLVSPREAKVTITAAGKSTVLEIFQAAVDIEVAFEPESLLFSSKPETQIVMVLSNVKDWTIESTPSWIVADRKEDTLWLTSEKNASSLSRESELIVQFEETQFPLRIRQMPGDTVLSVDKLELVLNEGFAQENLKVTCNMDDWGVESMNEWIEVSRNNDSILVSVMENPSVFSRHGSVHLNCGPRVCNVMVHQSPRVTPFSMPESELKYVSASDMKSVMVASIPTELAVFVDDTIKEITPFAIPVDYEHHSIQIGFERREYLFNENQQEIVFKPGLRFATLTFTSPKNIGLRTGFIGASGFGAYSHFQASLPLVTDYASDSLKVDGYHIMFGPIYSPIRYLGIYAGVGVGIHEGPTEKGNPNFGFAYEAGVMGLFKNVMVSAGFRNSQWGFNAGDRRTTFVFGIGGYLKRYYDSDFGYCASDSRRWWSLNYVARPAVNGKGAMIGDIGKDKVRAYIKALYVQPTDSVKGMDAELGMIFTPVNGIVDFCLGVGAGVDFNEIAKTPALELEAGFILNLWRIPLMVMLHESDILDDRHLYVDLGIGFHLGDFYKSSYK